MEKVAIIGMGTMGSAIKTLLDDKYEVSGFGKHDDKREVHKADVVIMAVKPQAFAAAANQLWRPLRDEQLVISVMAGVTIRALCQGLGNSNVVRTMPNLGLAKGQSLTAWLGSRAADGARAEAIIGMWGTGLELQDEAQFDAFTALAGSGPAYFFEIGRLLETAARVQGFDEATAQKIAAYTFLAAASVVEANTDFGHQVQRVASKGGTTEAAFGVFAQNNLDQTFYMAIEAARSRSQELSERV